MSDTTRIPFSFCRIKRAADFLGVSTADLLSLAVSEKITLCVRLDGLKSILWVEGNSDEITDWYLSLNTNHSTLALSRDISKHSSFSIDRISYDEENDEPIFNPWFYQSRELGKVRISRSFLPKLTR